MTTLPRKEHDDIPPTMFLRPRRPDDHSEFKMFLPWMTPLFIYRADGEDWVRWTVPRTVGEEIGLSTTGCSCCGEHTTLETEDDFQVDTAWSETSFWLIENGYALPMNTPTKGK